MVGKEIAMKLRDLSKMKLINDGSRSLFESIAIPEVVEALKDWRKASIKDSILIGGLAVSYYARPRATTDVDVLFLNKGDIPDQVEGFKRIHPGAFQHNKTHVEVDVVTPESINLPNVIATKAFSTSVDVDGILVASPSAIVVLKLHRMKRYDEGDIAALIETGKVDLTEWSLTPDQIATFNGIIERNSQSRTTEKE